MATNITGSNGSRNVIDVFAFTAIRPSIWAFIDVDPDRKGRTGRGEREEHCD